MQVTNTGEMCKNRKKQNKTKLTEQIKIADHSQSNYTLGGKVPYNILHRMTFK